MTQTPPNPRLSASEKLVVAGAAAATYVGASMGGAVSLALPHIASDLHFTAAQVQWIISGYLLARIAGLRPGGALCDRLGARRIFLLSMTGFAVTSIFCSLVSSEALLIGLRFVQGAFAALLSPSALVLLRSHTPPSKLAAAMSIWSAAGMAGFGLSPVLGGMLLDAWGWRSIFWVTALATIPIVFVGFRIREKAAPQSTARKPSILGELAVAAMLAAVAYFVGQYDWAMLCYALAAALILWLLVKREAALRPDTWMRGFAMAPQVCVGVFTFAAIVGSMLWASYFIQVDLRQSGLVFGLGCLPMAAAGFLACFITEPLLASKRSNLTFLLAGLSILGLGSVAYIAERNASLPWAISALAFAGLCYGFANASVTAVIMSIFPAERSGDASSIATLSKQFGQLLGITVVAKFRDLSGKAGGSDPALFYFLLMCGVAVVVCAALRAMQARRLVIRA
jgi:MFS family permease